MAGKKKRRGSRRFSKIRRHFPSKVPIEVLVAGGLIPFTPAQSSGMNSMIQNVQQSDFAGIANNLKSGFLGMDLNGNIDLFRAINPFDMDRARYTKMLVIAGIIGSVRAKASGKYTSKLFSKIPIVGRWIK